MKEFHSEVRYLKCLDATLLTLPEGATLDELLRHSRGAFPSLVAQRLVALSASESLQRLLLDLRDDPPKHDGHELHPLDYEWYFTAETAGELASLCTPGRVLCLGAPTVAAALAGGQSEVTLVDCNLTTLEEIAIRNPDVIRLHAHIPSGPETTPLANTVVLDPPWYPDITKRWLRYAARRAEIGGTLLMPLIQSLVRPSADADRREILNVAQQLGNVVVVPRLLYYETPRFEFEVLRHDGVLLSRPWRMADLLKIVVKHRPYEAEVGDVEAETVSWATYRVFGQTVKLRVMNGHGDRSSAGSLIQEVPGCVGYLLPSVSRRYPRLNEIDVWTSRNRVARITDIAAFTAMLEALQSNVPLHDLIGMLPKDMLRQKTLAAIQSLFDIGR